MKKDEIKKFCGACYWHVFHGCHIDKIEIHECVNTLVKNAIMEKLDNAMQHKKT